MLASKTYKGPFINDVPNSRRGGVKKEQNMLELIMWSSGGSKCHDKLLMSFMDGPQVIRNQIEKDLLPLDY